MRKTAIVICLLIGLNRLFAQTQYSNEWNINVGLGNSSLKYSLNGGGGNVKSAFGGNLGFGYTHFFMTEFGFSLGMEAAMYGRSLNIDAISTRYAITTPPGLTGSFTLNADYSDFKEKQSAVFVQLPLMLNFQIPLGSSAFFYLNAGGKYGFPVSASYNQTVNSITTTGYSSYTGQTFQNIPSHGFDTYHNVTNSDDLEIKSSFMFVFEAGFKWKTAQKNYLYTGIYLDTGVNNVLKKSLKELLEYNNDLPSDYKYNSILQTNVYDVKEIKTYAIGAKIRIAFGSGKEYQRAKKVITPKQKKEEPVQMPKSSGDKQHKPQPLLDED
ncbi:MAG: PorT family protein [Candidatus Azobacteroides sp.]|nr:PorT family protein [Candidatus Azobacteroides sp.]